LWDLAHANKVSIPSFRNYGLALLLFLLWLVKTLTYWVMRILTYCLILQMGLIWNLIMILPVIIIRCNDFRIYCLYCIYLVFWFLTLIWFLYALLLISDFLFVFMEVLVDHSMTSVYCLYWLEFFHKCGKVDLEVLCLLFSCNWIISYDWLLEK